MTYRNQLLFIASAIAGGPLSWATRVDLAAQIERIAAEIGAMEEAADERVEVARLAEQARQEGAVVSLAHWVREVRA